MTGAEFITSVRPRLGDVNSVVYSDSELLGYLNDAIDQLSEKRIAANDADMITEVSVTPGTTAVPDGFARFAGAYPLYFSGDRFQSLDGSVDALTVRYYAYKARIILSNEVPFGDDALPFLLNYVIVAASARIGGSAETEALLGGVMQVKNDA